MARILQADQAGPRVIARVVADATEHARAIIERAQSIAAEQQARAVEQGRALGRAEFAAALVAVTRERERLLSALEPQAIDIAMQAARRLLGEELTLRPQLVAHSVRPLLARLRRARQVTLRVHPDDRAAIDAMLERFAGSDALPGSLHVETDPAIERGGCVLISDIGTLDARVETQIDALTRALLAT
jgi:type III secretion system HrpE/YscL family protein